MKVGTTKLSPSGSPYEYSPKKYSRGMIGLFYLATVYSM